MGIFDGFKKSLEESPGRVMLQLLHSHAPKFQNLPQHIEMAAIQSHLDKKRELSYELDNITPNGAIKIGIQLQKKGLQTIDINITEGYAIWFTGLWLESMCRPGDDAKAVHESMLLLEKYER